MLMKSFEWRRHAYVTNPADPTQVTTWRLGQGHYEIVLIAAWGIEAKIYFHRRVFWLYDAWWVIRLFNFLENRWQDAQPDYSEDPMGTPESYR